MRTSFGLVALLATVLAGCASNQALTDAEYDPWEGFNRGVYRFNDALDKAVLKPVATGYTKVVPKLARRGVSNFYDNLLTPRSAVNNFLQGKPKRGFEDIARLLFNTTIGIGGLIDVASAGGLPEYDEDFGQTLAVWGVPDGPYIVLPFFGPSTLRDVGVRPAEILADPVWYYENTSVRDKLIVLEIIDLRSRLLSADRFLEDSKDPYVTLRESYLQNREYEIYDGNPPMDDFYDDFEDFEDEEADGAPADGGN